jgi:hypothetical protein
MDFQPVVRLKIAARNTHRYHHRHASHRLVAMHHPTTMTSVPMVHRHHQPSPHRRHHY